MILLILLRLKKPKKNVFLDRFKTVFGPFSAVFGPFSVVLGPFSAVSRDFHIVFFRFLASWRRGVALAPSWRRGGAVATPPRPPPPC